MFDWLGQEITLGCTVLYSTRVSNAVQLVVGKVVSLEPFKVERHKELHAWSSRGSDVEYKVVTLTGRGLNTVTVMAHAQS